MYGVGYENRKVSAKDVIDINLKARAQPRRTGLRALAWV